MKINFTKKEYATLVEMLLMADWVLHAHETGPTKETIPYAELRRKVLSHHKEMGMEDAFEYDPEEGEYYETKDYEDNAPHMEFIDAFTEQTFWDTLASKLASRDFAALQAVGSGEPLSEEERLVKMWEIEEHYQDEFEAHGLDNVRTKTTVEVH